MPRVAQPPRAKQSSIVSPVKSPLKIPLNDDRQEKAIRLQSRHALHDLQINQIKAAATPVRKLHNYERAASNSPKTPSAKRAHGKENGEDAALTVMNPNAMSPMKRVPILANFEEWMKMATDNKINATNSWNFALIDYFHDMSLLKEGDGVNFQKASCTLDGCVKIYTSRVDSVATETGRLLSGLADGGNKKTNQEEGEVEREEDREDDGEDGIQKRPRKKAQRSSEVTLAPSFASLQLKKFELEFSVDPLFKKASADFDEGGAKGLLLNHLSIDSAGRIVFDSSDDADDAAADASQVSGEVSKEIVDHEEGSALQQPNVHCNSRGPQIDLDALASRFFPDLARLDEKDICPSLKNFDLGGAATFADIPFLKAPEDWRQEKEISKPGLTNDRSSVFPDDDNMAGFDDDNETIAGFDAVADVAFGEGGEVWAKNAAIEPQLHVHSTGDSVGGKSEEPAEEKESAGVGSFDPEGSRYAISLHQRASAQDHEGILSYFDNALKKNWTGPEHWRIKRMKDLTKPAAPAKRKEKEPFEIDFLSPLSTSLAELIYTPATSTAAISLPKTQWRSKTRNLLPDDKHFNSRALLRLFTKPKARLGTRKPRSHNSQAHPHIKREEEPEGEIDEGFWARKDNILSESLPGDDNVPGNYDADFFHDDNGFPAGAADDDEFADAREVFSPGLDENPDKMVIHSMTGDMANAEGSQEGAFGTQLVTQSRRLRPEYVQYARVAKKVDVRRLKEEMWRGIGFDQEINVSGPLPSGSPPKEEGKVLKFTSVMNGLQQVYPSQAMADISTSYCFICLLHLANEKGLVLGSEPGLEELSIKKDYVAEISDSAY